MMALKAWADRGHRGVIEAVTGAGKTRVALVAIEEHLRQGGRAAVLVPTIELQHQWTTQIKRSLPRVSCGRRGDGGEDDLRTHQVVVAVAAAAARYYLLPPGYVVQGLLVADECHRYGAPAWARGLEDDFRKRLGLTATYERDDNGIEEWLDPYFSGVCFSLGYRDALRDRAICDFRVAFAGVRFEVSERAEFDEHDEGASKFKTVLHNRYGLPREPFGQFLLEANKLSKGTREEGARVARAYLACFSRRREVLARAAGKLRLLQDLVPVFRRADRSIVFSQTRAAAGQAIDQLRASGLRGAVLEARMSSWERAEVLADFEEDQFDVVAAPRLLDEGIDVPATDLAVILATSRSRRQMVQRMGRVLRRKHDGRVARIVVLFVEGTPEDPDFGSHEDFMDLVLPAALECRRFTATPSDRAALISFLSDVGSASTRSRRA